MKNGAAAPEVQLGVDLAIRLQDVTKSFALRGQEVSVLAGVNLELTRGDALAIVGHSGAGKSTLLSIMAGLERPTAGTVVTAGVDLTRLPARKLAAFRFAHVGFVFQQYHLVPTLTALENVMLPCAPWKVAYKPRERAAELLRLVGLGQRMDHLPAQLSGGEQQRVCIARALINRPTLLLADEPTGNLDERSEEEVVGLIRSLALEFGMSLLFVTHNLILARSFPRTLQLRDGTLFALEEVRVARAEG
jgi:putative ABC transport system ATP-binding protein